MGKYKVKVHIELIECDDDVTEHGPVKEKNGGFTMTISEKDAMSIDKCEQSVLVAAHPTIRDAISKHLSDISKKKRLKNVNQEKS
uniref:Uncharacterized protein n=1 Tax=uncultured Desulfobacterium sp. TaxID=201089 RepID=E1YD43_9BACT|nr:unknown protein [uncultured Desulfobacterium sp.]